MGVFVKGLAAVAAGVAAMLAGQGAMAAPQSTPHDLVLRDFHFRSGETLPELKLHYYTIGTPKRDAAGHVVNAVLLLHGTGGSGRSLMAPQFSDVLMVPGGLLDPAKYFMILPDDIGHGNSSKPSDGLRMKFPRYDYADMVVAEHAIAEHEGVETLRLVMGTSMGCMHSFLYAEMFPKGAKAAMPLACQAMALGGRNRLWREMSIVSIESDPAWQDGNYTSEPVQGLRGAVNLNMLVGASPWPMQLQLPKGAQVDAWYAEQFPNRIKGIDANDYIYQLESSRTYDPEPDLGKITIPLTWVNSGDDFINPPEMPMARADIKRVKLGKFVLIPAGADTHGHGTHTWAIFWKDELAALLKRSE